jgi:hypothetical protein
MAGHLSPREAARRLRALGYRWLVLEWNDYDNWTRGTEVREACEAEGLIFTIWMRRNFTASEARQAIVESQARGFVAEAEIPAESAPGVPNPQAQNWPELIFELSDLPISKGVATNFAPFTHHDGSPFPEKARPLVEAGWKCLTECYDMNGDPANWIERRAFFASHLGWHQTQPILGIYDPPGGAGSLDAFPTRDEYRNWSVWAAENLI